MPIMGDCPYDGCGEPLWVVEPDNFDRAYFLPHDCEGCGRRIWTHISRVDPWSATESDFLTRYEVDEEAKSIRPRSVGDTSHREGA